MMLFFSIIFATLSIATGKLVCQDFVPTDVYWNSSSAKIYWSSDDTFPTENFLAAKNPWQFGKGSVYKIRNCTDSALGIHRTVDAQCQHPPGTDPSVTRSDWVQIINPGTGHCLTTQTDNTLDFKTCQTTPTNLTQFFLTRRTVFYSNGCNNAPDTNQDSEIVTYYYTKPNDFYPHDWRTLADNKTMSVVERTSGVEDNNSYLYLVPTK